MFRSLLSLSLLLLCLSSVSAQAKLVNRKIYRETWDAAFVQDQSGKDIKVGHVHLKIEEVEKDGKKVLEAVMELRLQLQRENQIIEVKADIGSTETLDGQVIGVLMRQFSGKQVSLLMTGTRDGDEMNLKVAGAISNEKKFPWNPAALGLARQQTLYRDRKTEPGTTFKYQYYEATLASVVEVSVKADKEEEITLPGGVKRRLLRVEATPAKIANTTLPTQVLWLDPASLESQKSVSELPGVGPLSLIRCSQQAALAPNGKVPNIFADQSLRLENPIAEAHERSSIVWLLKVKDAADLARLMSQDSRQKIRVLDPETLEITVTAIRNPTGRGNPKDADEKDLKSNHYLNSDDAEVKKLAREAVGFSKDPLEKARKIERWVRTNMRVVDYSEAMAPADHVAKSLRGDCSEFAMLAAAMCKAEGIPARTALGLVYVDHRQLGPILAFHMWTEVFVEDQWLGLDATIGRGAIGPAHIKITQANWFDERSFKPLLPVTGFLLAKPKIKVSSVK